MKHEQSHNHARVIEVAKEIVWAFAGAFGPGGYEYYQDRERPQPQKQIAQESEYPPTA